MKNCLGPFIFSEQNLTWSGGPGSETYELTSKNLVILFIRLKSYKFYFPRSNPYIVPAVSKILITPLFWNVLNIETETDTLEKHDMKLLDLQKIYQHLFCRYLSGPNLQKFETVRAVNTFETSTL